MRLRSHPFGSAPAVNQRNQLVCFLLLLSTFLCWRRIYPSLHGLIKWLRERARVQFPRGAYSQPCTSHLIAENIVRQPRHKTLERHQQSPTSHPSLPFSPVIQGDITDRIPSTPSHHIPLPRHRRLHPPSATSAGLQADHLPDFGDYDDLECTIPGHIFDNGGTT